MKKWCRCKEVGGVSQRVVVRSQSMRRGRVVAAVAATAWNEGYPNVPEDFTITEKAPTSN